MSQICLLQSLPSLPPSPSPPFPKYPAASTHAQQALEGGLLYYPRSHMQHCRLYTEGNAYMPVQQQYQLNNLLCNQTEEAAIDVDAIFVSSRNPMQHQQAAASHSEQQLMQSTHWLILVHHRPPYSKRADLRAIACKPTTSLSQLVND